MRETAGGRLEGVCCEVQAGEGRGVSETRLLSEETGCSTGRWGGQEAGEKEK